MTKFLRLIAGEPDIASRAGDDRQLQVDGHRSGAEVRARQGDRQLDQPQGWRGRIPAPRAARPPLRRRGRRDGVRRSRARRSTDDDKVRICKRAYKLLTERGRLPAGRHHLRSEHPHRRHRHRRAQQLRGQLHRGDAADQGSLPRREDLRRREQRLVLVPRQRRRSARRCTRRSCITRSQPASTWASSTPASWRCTKTFRTELLELRRRRAAQSPARCHRAAGRVRRDGRRARRKQPRPSDRSSGGAAPSKSGSSTPSSRGSTSTSTKTPKKPGRNTIAACRSSKAR